MSNHVLQAGALAAALMSLPASAAEPFSHKDAFEHYEGTKTCIACHEQEAESFFHSQHYQWRGSAPQIVGAGERKLGKLNTINDFCTGPAANWIGLVTNSRGDVVSKGCSKCHAGRGKLPEGQISPAQLENIDCLICHAKGYQRDLYPNADGSLEWKPILWKNQEGLDSVAKRVGPPQRAMCLRCHSASGGGPNYKRGDLEYKLANTDRDYDVHMGTNGADFQCASCHAGDKHRVRGRGVDLAASDSPDRPLSCDTAECHGAKPHAEPVLDRHAGRVYCTSCHIRSFAREEPTDMLRDWSKPKYDAEADRYTASITLQKDVVPVYAWWNGLTRAQLPGEPVRRLPNGAIGMMVPEGTRQDQKARIFPFKLHKGRMPVLQDRQWIVPILVEHFFADGDIFGATRKAAEETYGIADAKYDWNDTERYMGIFHGVQPKQQALGCLECHGTKTRLDWKALGYAQDPLAARFASSAAK
ncbi:MAG: hypothetical protein AB7O37_07335 [Vicinamibacteria bacterium]